MHDDVAGSLDAVLDRRGRRRAPLGVPAADPGAVLADAHAQLTRIS